MNATLVPTGHSKEAGGAAKEAAEGRLSFKLLSALLPGAFCIRWGRGAEVGKVGCVCVCV